MPFLSDRQSPKIGSPQMRGLHAFSQSTNMPAASVSLSWGNERLLYRSRYVERLILLLTAPRTENLCLVPF